MTTTPTGLVKAVVGSIAEPSLHYRLAYLADETADPEPRTARRTPNPTATPMPVCIVLPGYGCAAEHYGWLALRLARRGFAVVTYSLIESPFPGAPEILTPGLDLRAATPDAYGTIPSCTALAPLLAALSRHNSAGLLAGALDLDRIGLIGHSGGASLALQNAGRSYLPGVRAAVSFGGHAFAGPVTGWPTGAVMPMAPGAAALVLGGEHDPVIAAAASSYHQPGFDADGVVAAMFRRTVRESVSTGSPGYLAVLRNAGHFTICEGYDGTTSADIDERDDEEQREMAARCIEIFLEAHVRGDELAAAKLRAMLSEPSELIVDALCLPGDSATQPTTDASNT